MLDGWDYFLEDNKIKELDKICKDIDILHTIWMENS